MGFFEDGQDFLTGVKGLSDSASDIVSGFDSWGEVQPTQKIDDIKTAQYKQATTQAPQAPQGQTLGDKNLFLIGAGLISVIALAKIL